MGAEKRTVDDATVEKPSSMLIVSAFGSVRSRGRLSVPSVEPLK